jgi:hypothetical protein
LSHGEAPPVPHEAGATQPTQKSLFLRPPPLEDLLPPTDTLCIVRIILPLRELRRTHAVLPPHRRAVSGHAERCARDVRAASALLSLLLRARVTPRLNLMSAGLQSSPVFRNAEWRREMSGKRSDRDADTVAEWTAQRSEMEAGWIRVGPQKVAAKARPRVAPRSESQTNNFYILIFDSFPFYNKQVIRRRMWKHED